VHLTAEQRAIVDGCKTLEGASAARRSFLERSLKTTSSFMGAPKDDDVAGWEVLPSPSNFVKMWRRIQADTDSTKVALGKAEAIIDVEAGAALKWYNTPCNNERTLGSLEEGDLARFVLKEYVHNEARRERRAGAAEAGRGKGKRRGCRGAPRKTGCRQKRVAGGARAKMRGADREDHLRQRRVTVGAVGGRPPESPPPRRLGCARARLRTRSVAHERPRLTLPSCSLRSQVHEA
jgi:hypothetical protein